jgi:hypothetical protein
VRIQSHQLYSEVHLLSCVLNSLFVCAADVIAYATDFRTGSARQSPQYTSCCPHIPSPQSYSSRYRSQLLHRSQCNTFPVWIISKQRTPTLGVPGRLQMQLIHGLSTKETWHLGWEKVTIWSTTSPLCHRTITIFTTVMLIGARAIHKTWRATHLFSYRGVSVHFYIYEFQYPAFPNDLAQRGGAPTSVIKLCLMKGEREGMIEVAAPV